MKTTMKTTMIGTAFFVATLGFAVIAQAAPAGKSPNPTRFHRVDRPHSSADDVCSRACCSGKGSRSDQKVRVGGKRNLS